MTLHGRVSGKRAVVAGLGFSLIATLLPAVGVSAGPGPIGDGLIRRPGGVLKGNGIYNNTAAGQMIYGGAYPAGTVRWAYIYAQNDFIDQRAFTIIALGDPVTGFSVKYFTTSGQDITAAVESTGYIGSAVAPGQRIAIRARVEITSAAAHGAVFSRFFQVGETTIYGFFEQDRVGLTLKRK